MRGGASDVPDDQTVQTNGPGTRQIPEPGSGWIYPARPVVFVGMPCYEGVTAQAARGLYAPTSGGVLAKTTVVGQSSLAPVAFNGLLTHALNDRDSGLVSHFAMIHPDVDPCLAWLDILWHELR